MENLLASRMSQRNQSPTRLGNLSPQKYGKGAYADMCYTPSKLADNILYRQVTTLKKYEGDSNKLREFEALNSFFKDRILQIEEQRDGIEQSLTKQIVMYKKMLHEMEVKHESRIRQIQKKFSTQIHKLIVEKEQEAKYAQSEKELLQNRIFELQQIIEELRDKLAHTGNNLDQLTNEHEKLTIRYQNIMEKMEKVEKKMKEDSEKAKGQYQALSRKLYNTEVDWQNKLENAIHNKNKEIQNLDRLHRTELQKVQNKRAADNMMRTQEMKDLKQTFETQAKRLNEIIGMKDRMVDSLTKQNNKEKATILELTKNYENQINNLSHEKGRLKENIEGLHRDIALKDMEMKDTVTKIAREKAGVQEHNEKLKKQLELTQVNYVRERDRANAISHDLERERDKVNVISHDLEIEINRLRSQNNSLLSISEENDMLYKEIQSLRELLMESSMEMERCKEQFLKMGCERDQLLLQVREMGFENQSLHRIKYQREEQAKGWKDSYFLHRLHN